MHIFPRWIIRCVGFATCLVFIQAIGTNQTSWESQLLKDIRQNYTKEVRPTLPANSGPLNVTVYISLLGIDDVNEDDNTFTATFILSQAWLDQRLKFNPSDYGNLKAVVLPSSEVWKPDLVPWNTAAMNAMSLQYGDFIQIYYSGRVSYVPLVTVTTKCQIDVSNFPFDTQTCTMMFGSWTYHYKEMAWRIGGKREGVINRTTVGANHPVYEHPEWSLVNDQALAKAENIKMPCCPPYDVIYITLKLVRRDSFYRSLAVAPGALLGLLVPFLFLLPSGSSEKTTYGMLILVGFTMLILVLQDSVPLNHNTTPRVGKFYLCTMFLTSLSVIISVFLSNMRMRGAGRRSVPTVLHALFLGPSGIRRFLFLEEYLVVGNPFGSVVSIGDVNKPEAEVPGHTPESKQETLLRDVCKYVRFLAGKVAADEAKSNTNDEWEALASVLDRILLILFFIVYLVTAMAFLT